MGAVVLQTRIMAILDGLSKAAGTDINQLIEEDNAAFNREIQRRDEQIETLKKRLQLTEKELKKVQTLLLASSDRCSVGVQVQLLDTERMAHRKEPITASHVQTFNTNVMPELKEEKPPLPDRAIPPSHHVTEGPKVSQTHASEPGRQKPAQHACDEDEFSSLEFEMKIEQVEELVDQELSLQRADYSMVDSNTGSKTDQRDAHLWSSVEDDMTNEFDVSDGCVGLEQYEQIHLNQCMASNLNLQTDCFPNKHVDSFGPAQARTDKDSDYGQLRDPVGHLTTQRTPNTSGKHRNSFGMASRPHTQLSTNGFSLTNPLPVQGKAPVCHAISKPFRCEECGKGFTQRTRLITHKRTHTGEKPYHCQLCGKMFSRQDNCLRHVRLHSGQRW